MLVNGGLKAETPEVDDNDAAEVKMREEAAEKMREVGAAINLSRQQQQGSAFHDLYTQHSKSFKEVRDKALYWKQGADLGFFCGSGFFLS